MKCRDILTVMPQHIHRRIRHTLSLDDSCQLDGYLTNEHFLASIYNKWKEEERYFFETMIQTFSFCAFDWNQLTQLAWDRNFPESSLRIAILRFCEQGVLFTFQQEWGERVFIIPVDAYITWKKILNHKKVICTVPSSTLIEGTIQTQLPASIRIIHLLSALARKPIRVTKSGDYHRKDMKHMADQSQIMEQDLSFWLNWCLKLGLIMQTDRTLHIHLENIRKCLAQKNVDWHLQLFIHWLLYNQNQQPVQKHHLYVELMSIQEDCWMNISVPEEMGNHLKNTLIHLAKMGWMEYVWNENKVLVRKVPVLDREPALYVIEDFEIIPTPHLPYRMLWELELIANRKTDRSGDIYQLTKDSIHFARQFGRNSKDIIRFLAKYAKYGVPENVLRTIQEWGNSKVPSSDAQHFYCMDHQKTIDYSNGYLSSNMHSFIPYIPPKKLPDLKDIYPKLEQLPRIWLMKPRCYHRSTKLQIIMQAIQWKAYLKLKNDSTEMHIIPDEIRDETTGQVMARSETGALCLCIDEWKEIQLILPGINDTTNSNSCFNFSI